MSEYNKILMKEELLKISDRTDEIKDVLVKVRDFAEHIKANDIEDREMLRDINKFTTFAISKLISDVALSNFKTFKILKGETDV